MSAQIVIFGASGDLTARKLVPALLGSFAEGAFPGPVQVVGVARRPKQDWRAELTPWIPEGLLGAWHEFAPHVHYRQADAAVPADLARLHVELEALSAGAGRLFYLALKPALFAPTVGALRGAGLLDGPGWRRCVVEKPFGRDLSGAQALNVGLREHLAEDQLFRIDHYLGKETVQNILAFRFQNAVFEPLWNREHVESVEISVCETVGMEGGRAGYYDQSGAIRDMVQNHLLQLLALVAMEAPSSMAADAVRNEKVKVLQSLRRFTPERVATNVVRAQYAGYLDEPGVAEGSKTETYVAIRAAIHNWRWNGVPFLLRTGKCLSKRYSEIILNFRVPPVDLLGGPVDGEVCRLRPNRLRLLIQPTEGFRLSFLVKHPGTGSMMRQEELGFDYSSMGAPTAPAYQRLLLDAVKGDPTLFIRGDETEAAWSFVDSIRDHWEDAPVATYARGSMGPVEADELFRGCEGTWGTGVA